MSWDELKDHLLSSKYYYFHTDNGVLLCGDCLEVMKELPEKSVDAIITDPPFGIGFRYGSEKEKFDDPESYWSWFQPIYSAMLKKLKPGGFVAIWQAQLYFRYFWSWFGDQIHIYAACKNFVQLRKTPINYAYDPIVMFYKEGSKPLRPKHPKRNVDFFVANTAKWVTNTKAIERKHPCPRPIDQVEVIVENFTIFNGIVLDPFLGSGTTAVACEKLNRKWIGIEIEEKYCKITKERIRKVINQKKLDLET